MTDIVLWQDPEPKVTLKPIGFLELDLSFSCETEELFVRKDDIERFREVLSFACSFNVSAKDNRVKITVVFPDVFQPIA